MFRKNWKPDITQAGEEIEVPTESLYRLWQYYVEKTNDRQYIHQDDDLWGINTYVLGKQFGSREQLATSSKAETEVFREKLIALLEYKKLCMPDVDAVEVYGEQSIVKNGEDLAQLGVVFDINIAVDLTTMVTVQRGEPHFNFFFALKLVQLKLSEIGTFLDYQFQESFNSDFLLFKQFILGLSLQFKSESQQKMPGLPTIGHDTQLMIDSSIKKIKKEQKSAAKILKEPTVVVPQNINEPELMKETTQNFNELESMEGIQEEKPETEQTIITQRQQALILILSLEALGLDISNTEDLSNIAKLLHLLTGRPFTKIQNSTPYKILRKVQSMENKNVTEQDLILLRAQFENVNWNKAVDKTDLKINRLKEKYKKQKI